MSPSFPKGPQEYVDRLTALLPDFSTRVIEQDERRSGPQARALHWLASDENFENYDNVSLLQRFALATFYFATGGPTWSMSTGWLDSTDDCTWFDQSGTQFGLEPCTNGRRTAITLFLNDLVGVLPPEIGLLSDLEVLTLHGSQIAGQIPTEVGLLTNLKRFNALSIAWTGTIPTTIGSMTELQNFQIEMAPLDGK